MRYNYADANAKVDAWSSRSHKINIQDWIISSIPSEEDFDFFDVTLTFRQSEYVNGMYLHIKDEIKKFMKRFIAQLNRRFFGNAYKRYGKKIFSLITIEQGLFGKNTHVHGFLGIKKNKECKKDIIKTIEEVADSLPMINERKLIRLQNFQDDHAGWAKYILKEFFDPNFLEFGNFKTINKIIRAN